MHDMSDSLSQLAQDIIKADTYARHVLDGGTPPEARELLADVAAEQLLGVPPRHRVDREK